MIIEHRDLKASVAVRYVGHMGVHDHLEINDFFGGWDGGAVDFDGQGRDFSP